MKTVSDFLKGYAHSPDSGVILLLCSAAERTVKSVSHPVVNLDPTQDARIRALRQIAGKRGLEIPKMLAEAAIRYKANVGEKRAYWKVIYGALDTLVRDEGVS